MLTASQRTAKTLGGGGGELCVYDRLRLRLAMSPELCVDRTTVYLSHPVWVILPLFKDCDLLRH